MALCPQLPQPSPASYQPYPSWSKSPSPTAQFKASRRLPTLNYPLTDITNFPPAQATIELSNLTSIAAHDEPSLNQVGDIPSDAPPRRGRGKNKRGRHRGVRFREVGGSSSGGKLLRSPIPLAALSSRSSFHPAFDFRGPRRKSAPALPILSDAFSSKFLHNTANAHPRTPRRRSPSVSAVTLETSRPASKRTKRWAFNSPHDKSISPPNLPYPTPTLRRAPYSDERLFDAPSSLHQLPSPPPIRFPTPPSTHPNHLLPSMNLGSGLVQGQMRRKRTKRDLAEVQWQITMHKSLAWRTTHEHFNTEKMNVCEHCTRTNKDPSHGPMDFAQVGLRIAFERPACTCARDNKPQAGYRGAQLHWTESLDRELVKRLWVKLIAQGCRTIPTGISNSSQGSTPVPTVEHSQPGIPFPSEQPEQLAPAIQLFLTSRPNPRLGSEIPLRQRALAITSSNKRASLLNLHVSSPIPSNAVTASMRPSSPFPDPPYSDSQCRMPQVSARISRGSLSSAQLTAQSILRHEDARSKPMRRGRPPGIVRKGSSLRHEVTAGHAD